MSDRDNQYAIQNFAYVHERGVTLSSNDSWNENASDNPIENHDMKFWIAHWLPRRR